MFLSGLFESYLRECDMNSWRFNSFDDFSGFHHARLLHRSAAKQPRPDGGSLSSDDRDVVVTRDANVVGVAAFVARSARHDSTVSWFDERASNRGLCLSTSQRQPQCRKDFFYIEMLNFVKQWMFWRSSWSRSDQDVRHRFFPSNIVLKICFEPFFGFNSSFWSSLLSLWSWNWFDYFNLFAK